LHRNIIPTAVQKAVLEFRRITRTRSARRQVASALAESLERSFQLAFDERTALLSREITYGSGSGKTRARND
jgi:hypothetical protein